MSYSILQGRREGWREEGAGLGVHIPTMRLVSRTWELFSWEWWQIAWLIWASSPAADITLAADSECPSLASFLDLQTVLINQEVHRRLLYFLDSVCFRLLSCFHYFIYEVGTCRPWCTGRGQGTTCRGSAFSITKHPGICLRSWGLAAGTFACRDIDRWFLNINTLLLDSLY